MKKSKYTDEQIAFALKQAERFCGQRPGCGHDIIAVGAIAMCSEMGVAVPGDMSITGFEDLDLASNVVPALTTVHFPAHELGAVAGAEMLRHIEGGVSHGQIELPISLVVRGTTDLPGFFGPIVT